MTKKKIESEISFPSGVALRFETAEGRWVEIEVIGSRIHHAWGIGNKGRSQTSTRHSPIDAMTYASKKIKKYLKDGYVEVESQPRQGFDMNANVVEVFRSSLSAIDNKTPVFDYQPMEGRPFTFSYRWVFWEFLICNQHCTRAISFRVHVYKPPVSEAKLQELVYATLDEIDEKFEEIMGDTTTPVRKLALHRPIGAFTHLAVISPEAYNFSYFSKLGRSLWEVFPCYDCEFSGTENVCLTEARITGKGIIPSASLWRKPYPVYDLYYRNPTNKKESVNTDFLQFDPAKIGEQFGPNTVKIWNNKPVEVRNYRLEVRSYPNGGQVLSAEELTDLRSFLGFDD